MWGRIHTFGLFPSETVQFVRQAGKDFARGEGQNLIKKNARRKGTRGRGARPREGVESEPGAEGRIGRGRCGETTSPSENGGFRERAGISDAKTIRWGNGDLPCEPKNHSAAAFTAFTPTIAQQCGRVMPSRLSHRLMQVRTHETDVGQHVIVETGQQLQIAPVAPNCREPIEPSRHCRGCRGGS